jgi:uncharacterized peroxidase-related enzyme
MAIKPAEPAENPYLSELEKKTGRESNFFRIMGRKPEVLQQFVPLYGTIMGRGSVDRRIKELIYLTVSYANESPYCTATHTSSAPRAGVTPEEMRALQTEQDHSFNEAERAAIQYARELTQTAAADETRDALQHRFQDEQIVEITLVAAMANFTNRFNNGLEIAPEE